MSLKCQCRRYINFITLILWIRKNIFYLYVYIIIIYYIRYCNVPNMTVWFHFGAVVPVFCGNLKVSFLISLRLTMSTKPIWPNGSDVGAEEEKDDFDLLNAFNPRASTTSTVSKRRFEFSTEFESIFLICVLLPNPNMVVTWYCRQHGNGGGMVWYEAMWGVAQLWGGGFKYFSPFEHAPLNSGLT